METQTDTRTTRNFLEPLTSFRFIAALGVFVWHSSFYASVTDRWQLGYAGVTFFFVLSGFILTYAYYTKLRGGAKRPILHFYNSRVAKLFPIHLVTLIVVLPLALQTFASIFPEHTKLTFIGLFTLNASLLHSYLPTTDASFSFNGVSWSISNELFFYALFPLLIVALSKLRRRRVPLKLLFVSWLVMWAVLTAVFATRTAHVNQWWYYIFPPLRLVDFSLGILLGYAFLRATSPKRSPARMARLKPYQANLVEAAAVLAVAAAVLVSPLLPQTLRFSLFLMPFFGILIYVFAWKQGIISRLLSVRPLVFLGNASFSFYMIHQIIIRYVKAVGIGHMAPLSFVLSLSLASIIYIFFEEPARLKLRGLLDARLLGGQFERRLHRFLRVVKLKGAPKAPSIEPAD